MSNVGSGQGNSPADRPSVPAWKPHRVDQDVWSETRPVNVTVSGSFRRYDDELNQTILAMRAYGLNVLSPNSGSVESIDKGFAYLHGDPSRDKRWTEDRHLEGIRESDFLWILNRDGYLGVSTAFEMGFARASGVPIYAAASLQHEPIGSYAEPLQRWREAAKVVTATRRRSLTGAPILISPHQAVQRLAEVVADMEEVLGGADGTLTPTQASRLRDLAGACTRLLGPGAR